MENSNSNNSVNLAEDEDPVESMLKKTGCIEQHYEVQECIAQTKDWRKCQEVVQRFKECMNKHARSKGQQQ